MRKGKTVSFRLDDEEYGAVVMIAKELKMTLSEAYRTLVFEGIQSFKESGDLTASPAVQEYATTQDIQTLSERWEKQCEQVRQHVDALSFSMLYHTLPVHEEHREEAQRSAWERFSKYKSITRKIDDESAAKRSGTAKSS